MQATFPDYLPTVPQLLAAGRERFGDNECVVTPDARLSYRELDDQSKRLAARLAAAGVGKSARVGLLFPNSAAWVVAWAAAARLGAVTLPINTFYKPSELATFLRHADVQYILGVDSFIHHDYVDRLETVAPELADHGPAPLRLPGLPQLRRVWLWGESPRTWAEGGYGSAMAHEEEWLSIVEGMEQDVMPSDALLVTYTSGSTGEPKGVVHSHGTVIRHARNLASLSNVDEESRLWTPMPLFWVGGFSFTLLRALSVGGCFLSQDVFEAGAALRFIEAERVTNVAAWPGITKTLTENPYYAEADLSSIRSGSFYDAIPADRRPPDPELSVTSLGMSETCGPHTFWWPEEDVTGSPEEYRGSFGHEVPGTEHRIVDPERGVDVPEGEEGEVLVRGYNLMMGLYKHERSEVFDADGWYHTGDRGYFRDGWFFFAGRQTDLVKTSGSNVAPAEVEKWLLNMPEVKLAYVIGVPHPDRGEDVVALLVLWRDSDSLTPELVKERLRQDLSSYKIPRQVFVIGDQDVPWLVSQKVDRRALAVLAQKLTQT